MTEFMKQSDFEFIPTQGAPINRSPIYYQTIV